MSIVTNAGAGLRIGVDSVSVREYHHLSVHSMSATDQTVERAVLERYSQGARRREAALCCPVEYDSAYLAVLPAEIIERDYGCGDPSRYVEEGETVLDLGSGGGKICYIAAQKVGPTGRVIGVDMNVEMLALARKYQDAIAGTLGYRNVSFFRGKIQDLALDLERVDQHLERNPVGSASDLQALQEYCDVLRTSSPMIDDDSVDVVVSNCVLNLVAERDKKELFNELFRVLKRGGRAVISDIVSDEEIPQHLKENEDLWSGCLSGAFTEEEFLAAFEEAGFHGIQILERDEAPWQTVEGIEFRSVTVAAYKGKQGPCIEKNQAVIYRGPWKSVTDDDGHTLFRGERMAVCEKTYHLYGKRPYRDDLAFIEPYERVTDTRPFDCSVDGRRLARVTKGLGYAETIRSDEPCCGPDGCC